MKQKMKRITILLLMAHCCALVNAQVSSWVINPVYDSLYFADGAPLLLGDSLGVTRIWNLEGKYLSETPNILNPFIEGMSVVTEQESDVVKGIYDEKGNYTNVPVCKVAYSYPYFSDGYLLVHQDDSYFFINPEGRPSTIGNGCPKIYPFNSGITAAYNYEVPDKQKNRYYMYFTTKNKKLILYYLGKPFADSDVEFLSSLSDDGIGIAVLKHKAYYFDVNAMQLTPVFENENETNIKNQVLVDGDIHEFMTETADSVFINARSGKVNKVTFSFDKLLRPSSIKFQSRTVRFEKKTRVKVEYSSDLHMVEGDDVYGVEKGGKTILPPQFQQFGFAFRDYAVVRASSGWGMLTHDDDIRFKVRMNKGNDIAFRHQFFDTTVRLDMPPVLDANKCRFDILSGNGCEIDKTSRESRNTESGSYVQYDCTLTIPPSLPDVLTELKYPVSMTYDGILHPTVYFTTKAWHYKYINVDLYEPETTIEQGDVSFTLNITAEKALGENDYPFEVTIQADTLQCDLEKISETRYKCRLYSLAEGVNNININILEKGCPPAVFPFEITYVKPVEKKGRQEAVKESVKIQKKSKTAAPVEVPHIEI